MTTLAMCVSPPRRNDLGPIVITSPVPIALATVGRWFSKTIDGPTVLVGEEIPEIAQHLVAVGIEKTIGSGLDLATQIAEIHKQGGIAIAAHPGPQFWSAFEGVLTQLDGTEVCHPYVFVVNEAQEELAVFAARTPSVRSGPSSTA